MEADGTDPGEGPSNYHSQQQNGMQIGTAPNTQPATADNSPERRNERELLERNEDYQIVSSTLTVLRNQLLQAEDDLERLMKLKEEALQDPVTFVEKLLAKDIGHIPRLQKVVAIPPIDLYKYAGTDAALSDTNSLRPRTRTQSFPLSDLCDRSFSPGLSTPPITTPFVPNTAPFDEAELSTKLEAEKNVRENSKSAEEQSATFNQAWTEEENARLLELLDLYPPEPIAQRRLEKISAALGSRTPRQVGSRLQKMFPDTKAARVLGRSSSSRKKSSNTRPPSTRVSGTFYSNKFSGSRYLGKPMVSMSDDEIEPDDTGLGIDPKLKNTDEYKELIRLQKLAKLKGQNVPAAHTADPVHYGYSCDRCSAEPIVGTRWKCLDCPSDRQVDLCNDCMTKGFQNDSHTPIHRMEKIETPELVDIPDGEDPYAYLGFRNTV